MRERNTKAFYSGTVDLDLRNGGGFAHPGEDIREAIHRARSKTEMGTHEEVTFKFNGQPVIVNRHDSAEKIYTEWADKMEAAASEWRNSPEGQAYQREELESAVRTQAAVDRATNALEVLDLSNADAVLDWIATWYDAADHIGVVWPHGHFTSRLIEAGWIAGDCTGDLFRADHKPTVAKYLIGQALSFMQKGRAPHPVFGSFLEKYRAMP